MRRLLRTTHGVGYIDEGPHGTRLDGKTNPAYQTWRFFMDRCYGKKNTGVWSVHPQWHSFNIFAEWYFKQRKQPGWGISPNALNQSTREYGPDNSAMLPRVISSQFVPLPKRKTDIATGVERRGSRYVTALHIDGESKHLGSFMDEAEASECYKEWKEAYVRSLVDDHKNYLDEFVINRLKEFKAQ